jgi:16S rRNA (uracil1498-N3)-methyltransferase
VRDSDSLSNEIESNPQAQGHAPRLFLAADLGGTRVTLEPGDAHYLGTVLRLGKGEQVTVFNGRGEERRATIDRLDRQRAELSLGARLTALPEPTLETTLIQALPKNDAMDLIVQKATELGVRRIYAVKTDHSVVRLDASRAERRLAHWRKIAQSACEQSGRHLPPLIQAYASLAECIAGVPDGALRIALDPHAPTIGHALPHSVNKVCLLVGPEGGFSAADLAQISAARFTALRLGPRTLRAETAAITACAFAALRWGDLRVDHA